MSGVWCLSFLCFFKENVRTEAMDRFSKMKGNYLFLLLSLGAFYLFITFSENWAWHLLAIRPFFAVVLLASVYSVSTRRSYFLLSLILMIVALIGELSLAVMPTPYTFLFSTITKVVMLIFTIAVILTDLFQRERVSFNTIYGAVCVYVMIGILWAMFYVAFEYYQPGTFAVAHASPLVYGANGSINHYPFSLFYYSFVTLSTLGFGDVVPTTQLAQSCSALEAVIGQLYLVILVARFVGLHIHHSHSRRRDDEIM